MKRVITISLGWAMFAAAAAPALGGEFDCVFKVTNGVWNDMVNWDFCGSGWPDSDDTAKILTDQTVTVDADADVFILTVDAGATVEITTVGTHLTIHEDAQIDGTLWVKYSLASVDILKNATVDGLIRLGANAANKQAFLFGGDGVVIDGCGTIDGDNANGAAGGVIHGVFWDYEITIGPDVTVTGSIHVATPHLINNGTFRVDDPGDVMKLGVTNNCVVWEPTELAGSGKFVVDDGTLNIGLITLFDPAGSLTWEVNGGTMEILAACQDQPEAIPSHPPYVGCQDFRGDIIITGGTLRVGYNEGGCEEGASLCSEDKLTFSGGTIDVAASASACFSAAECP